MNEIIGKVFEFIDQGQSPEEINRILLLPPGCEFKTWYEGPRWNQIKGCWEKRRCGEFYDCDDPINNNRYCNDWECQ